MGEWGSVTYVHTSRRRHLASTMKKFLEREGFSLVHEDGPQPDAETASGRVKPYLRAVVIGTRGAWTAVKISDSEFMCRRREGQDRPRISELAIFLGRSAFQVSVYDGDSMTLLEASKSGRVCVSGGEAATSSRRFHEELIARKRHFDPGFHLLRVDEDLENVGTGDWMDIAAHLVPGVEPDLVATDALFASRKTPAFEFAKWMAFKKPRGSAS